MEKSFSLKDQLFNPQKVEYLAQCIQKAYPPFKKAEFVQTIVKKFPELELKQRIVWIRENIAAFLPNDYPQAVGIILNALPEECDPNKTDDDFGDFIFAPFGDFIAHYGCTQKHLSLSFTAIEEITKRFSCEDAIRYFFQSFPEKTLLQMAKWSISENYHVRRLASEGSRPFLPWSQKIYLDHRDVIQTILSNLFSDPTRYVVRSVANHLNDISKINPELVVETLKKWELSEKQSQKEMEYLKTHSLRTLVKKGHKKALLLLGYEENPNITVQNLLISEKTVEIGTSAAFSFLVTAHQQTNLMIDYLLHFPGKNGELRPKVFKIKKISVQKGQQIEISKKHPLRQMTTKKLYAGVHKVEIQINGEIYAQKEFILEV